MQSLKKKILTLNSLSMAKERIPELFVNKAPTSFLFLAAPRIIFLQEVNYPWYSANRSISAPKGSLSDGSVKFIYSRHEFMTVLSCIEQHQFCAADSNSDSECAALSPRPGIAYSAYDASLYSVWRTENQRAAVHFALSEIRKRYFDKSGLHAGGLLTSISENEDRQVSRPSHRQPMAIGGPESGQRPTCPAAMANGWTNSWTEIQLSCTTSTSSKYNRRMEQVLQPDM